MNHWIQLFGWAALVAACAVAPLGAQAAPAPQALVLTAHNLMAGDARHQELAKQGRDSATVLPGDVIRYRLRFTNVTDAAVRNVVFHNPLAGGLRYVAGSARADRDDVTMDYSIDGGRSYSAQPMIEVVIDGKRERRPAPPERYTHVRWTVRGALAAGAQVTAEFKAQLPPTGAALRDSGEQTQQQSHGR